MLIWTKKTCLGTFETIIIVIYVGMNSLHIVDIILINKYEIVTNEENENGGASHLESYPKETDWRMNWAVTIYTQIYPAGTKIQI